MDGVGLSDCFPDGVAPLHFAVANGRKEIVSLLLDKGADIQSKNEVGSYSFDRLFLREGITR
jgi:ankyrin repeat protein